MEIDFPYSLSDQDARARLELLGTYLGNKHGIKVTWVDATRATFHGKYLVVRIDGELSVGSGYARFRGDDPGFLWRARAKDYIQGKLAKYLDPSASTSTLPTSERAQRRRERAVGVVRRHALALEATLEAFDDAPQRKLRPILHDDPHARRAVVGLTGEHPCLFPSLPGRLQPSRR